MIFQCKNCGGNVIYSPERKTMYCPFCDSTDSAQRRDTAGDLRICPNCGGELPIEEHTSAVRCPYCDNYLIFNERIEGQYAPEKIIPFQYSREMIKKLLRERFARCLFAPVDFLSEVMLDTMEGDYVPFWLYDYQVNCQFRGEGRKIRVWMSGDMEYTETSVYDIYRDMDVNFEKVPADASLRMPDEIMDAMEPYGYGQMVPFLPEYLSGFQGEKYNMPADQTKARAEGKMEEDALQLMRGTITGYGSVSTRSQNVRIEESHVSYGLLPVWVYHYQYKDREYPFYINGQTAKIVGEVPTSMAKVWSYGATLWALLTAMLALLYGILVLW